tara:strand:+ start:91 stop:1131 length:1041 start_codon:yes stop_codon:yes gene_type:complete
MRILYFAPPNVGLMGDFGGVLRLMRLHEMSLVAMGHTVDYLSPWDAPDLGSYDVCHAFMANGNSYSVAEILHHSLPLVVSPIIDNLHSNFSLRLNVWLDHKLPVFYSHIGRCAAMCQMADKVCLMSSEEQRCLTEGLGVTSSSAVTPCPIVDDSAAPCSERFNTYSDTPYILFLGDGGNPRKNVLRLIEAVSGLDTPLLIGGMISEGVVGNRVKALANSTPNVTLVGRLSAGEKTYLLQHAAVFVLPSLMEGLGLAATEAALLGTTVVVTTAGGPRDYFEDLAYYVDPNSVSDIRDKIVVALREPRDASKRMKESFSVEAMGRHLDAQYQDAISTFSQRNVASTPH